MPAVDSRRAGPVWQHWPDTVVLDASAALRLILAEPGSVEALELVEHDIRLIAPQILLAEVGGVLRRKVAERELPSGFAEEAFADLLDAVADGTVGLAPESGFAGHALSLALSTGAAMGDCLYLALAEREGAGLATADPRMGEYARGLQLRTILLPR